MAEAQSEIEIATEEVDDGGLKGEPDNGDGGEQPKPTKRKKKKKKRKASVEHTGSSSPDRSTVPQLPPISGRRSFVQPASDDVLPVEEGEPQDPEPLAPTAVDTTNKPVPTTDTFLQHTKKFVKVDPSLQSKIDQQLCEQRQLKQSGGEGDTSIFIDIASTQVGDIMKHGLYLQTGFRYLTVVIQGVLTGFLVCHCLFLLLFGPPYGSYYSLIRRYSHFALPLHSMLYAGLAVCTVAALDKYDLGSSLLTSMKQSFLCQNAGLHVVFYFVAVACSMMSLPIEERMDLFTRNVTHYFLLSDTQGVAEPIKQQPWLEQDMLIWRWTLIIRAVAVVLAWFLIAFNPSDDTLKNNMQSTNQEDSNTAQQRDILQSANDQPGVLVAGN